MVIPSQIPGYYTYRIFFVKLVFHAMSESPRTRKICHLESEESSVAQASTALISKALFHYGGRGLL